MPHEPDSEMIAAGIKDDGLPGRATPTRRQGTFKLLRYFSIASFVAIASSAVLLGFFYRQTAVKELIELKQENNSALARVFANALRAEYLPLVEASGGLNAEELKTRPEILRLNQWLLTAVEGTSVIKVKVFDLRGLTVYSSEFRQIGQDKRDYPGFVAARAGSLQSELVYRESFHAFGRTIVNRHVLGSYVPVRRPGSDAIEAVLEIYSDVTPFLEDVGETQSYVVARVVVVLILLYGVLFVIVRHADGLMRRQEEERMGAAQAIERHAMQQSLIAEFGHAALASPDIDELLARAVATVGKGLDVKFCGLLQLGPDGRSLVLKTGSGWEGDWTGRAIALVDAQEHPVLERREPRIRDFEGGSRARTWELLAVHGIRSGVEVAIGGGEGPFGVLGAYAQEHHAFSRESGVFLDSLANTLETAIRRKSAEDRISNMAQFDFLTGLPNRRLFSDRLAQTLTLAKRNGWVVCVLFIDLDRFKVVNDTYGHGIGDKLLKGVAQRLQECVRSGDTVGRQSGDEFAIVLSNLAKPDDASLVAQKVLAAMARPFDLEGFQAHMSASLGIALYPADGEDSDELLKNADMAMFRAKEQGRNGYQFYLPEMNERAAARFRAETELRGALERGEFLLHYQPKADLASGEISGFEALLRWQHPQRGLVQPLEFVSILEDTGLIVMVGEWVMRTACAQIKRWQSDGLAPRPIAVNLSARQFQETNLDSVIAGILGEYGIDPGLLELELTESMLMKNAEEAARTLTKISACGVGLAIDDFGTGYSSLAYLRHFTLDVLKIDRAFVRNAATNPEDGAIVLAMISLAHGMRLKVVAEGVETEAQLNFLRVHGCDEMQGYLFSRALPAEECTRALAEGRRLRTPALSATSGAPAILLVDDNEEDLELLKRALAPDGYRIVTASTPEAGFEALAQGAFHVVISDYRMPGMNGVDFLARVRTLYPDALRIMVSGTGEMATVVSAVNEARIHKYLFKDAGSARLRTAVREAYRRHRKEVKVEV